jgi:hypothetical protein
MEEQGKQVCVLPAQRKENKEEDGWQQCNLMSMFPGEGWNSGG